MQIVSNLTNGVRSVYALMRKVGVAAASEIRNICEHAGNFNFVKLEELLQHSSLSDAVRNLMISMLSEIAEKYLGKDGLQVVDLLTILRDMGLAVNVSAENDEVAVSLSHAGSSQSKDDSPPDLSSSSNGERSNDLRIFFQRRKDSPMQMSAGPV